MRHEFTDPLGSLPTLRKRIASWMTLTIGILAILLSIAAALYLAHRQVVEEQSQRSSVMAHDLLLRAEAMGTQALAADRMLREGGTGDQCSPDALSRMRDIALRYNYIEAIGVVRDGRLMCSSFGRHDPELALGPVAYTSTLNVKVRPSVDLGSGKNHHFLVLQKGNYAAAIHPGTLLDVFPGNRNASFGIFGVSSGVAMGSRGIFESAWPRRLGHRRQVVFFQNDYLVAISRSDRFDVAAYVAIPGTVLESRFYALARVLVPLGLLLGLGLALAAYLLARQQNSLQASMRGALRRHEFVLHYQPVVDLGTSRMVGVEALVRWQRRDGKGLRPSVFIPVAEEHGIIGKFTDYVLARVAEDAPAFLDRHPDCYISINLASADVHGERIVASLRHLLDTPGVAAHNLMVEVTEYGLLDARLAGPNIRQIRDLGIRVAIDDFGTGYSNLSHLATLDIDCVKIDKRFVDTGGTDSPTSQVVLHIIEMARELELSVIAEGVGSETQARFLRAHGVHSAHAWPHAKPLPIDALLPCWPWTPHTPASPPPV